MKSQVPLVAGCLCFLSVLTLAAIDKEMSKATSCHISFNTQPLRIVSHCLGWMLLQVSTVFTAYKHSSWFWELKFPTFVCIAVRQADPYPWWVYTPVRWSLCSSLTVCFTQQTLRFKCLTFNIEFLKWHKNDFCIWNKHGKCTITSIVHQYR